ncbi:hypothetical protein DUNSADRAFT_1869 [Dunaliella salina]|uniref:Uncharacterized protein n=1 Tax=Dunaliella salina TaxID=3046 RepID=A0ABQ7FWX4_DUNSA|nr:hypothetical protein DUNSADRAFT_1869 [Dunaliella salina]|eukprot:KAF5826859.1 hypothetical protein DUNSADRAFT_1869 [Dunaliella salina]
MEADSASIGLYHAEVQKALEAEHAQLHEMQAIKEDLRATRDMVLDLPSRLRRQVFVPFGPHAFFPGQLQHTNELTVHLGASHYAKVTAKHAAGVLKRRETSIDKAILACQQQVEAHEARLRLASKEVLGLGVGPEEREIRESYEESEALLASARVASWRKPQGPGVAQGIEHRPSLGQPVPAEGEEAQEVGKWGGGSGVSLRGQQQQQQQQQQRRQQKEAGGDSAQAAGSEGDEYTQLFARLDELEAAEEAARLRAEEDGEEEEEEEEEEKEGGLQAGAGKGDIAGARECHPHNRSGALVEAEDEGREPDSDDEDDWMMGQGEANGSRVASVNLAAATSSAAQAASKPVAPAAPVPGPAARAAFPAHTQEPLKGAPKKSSLKKGFLLSSPSPAPPITQVAQQQQPQPAVSLAAAASSSKEMAFSRERAFTGQVLERPGLQAPLIQQQELQEQQEQQQQQVQGGGEEAESFGAIGLHEKVGAGVGAVTEVKERVVMENEGDGKGKVAGAEGIATAARRPSKFKQKMMGLG